jgi:uncharacterized UPF0160 family protein
MSNSLKVITHNGQFHPDDVCAVATIMHVYGKENINVLRTRDRSEIEKADIVVDVGGVYNPKTKRFDHHQEGRGGERANGVPYASFGLVWKEYGEKLCVSKKAADIFDLKLVQPIDAVDNGVAVSSPIIDGVYSYTISDLFQSYQGLGRSLDEAFFEAVDLAYNLIDREIKKTENRIVLEDELELLYYETEDKRLIVAPKYYPVGALVGKPEPLYIVYPDDANGNWMVKAVPLEEHSFALRKPFPRSWGGKSNEDFEKECGVEGAVFCHNNLFIISAKTKEAATRLARIALDNN